ncbi:MAG: S-layer homology domain-containing protein [Oscillibacter sp.]|nr:S-layer homology domain-containing protein [Oscillibacter sp.]
MKKKLFSILLSLAMCLSLLPTAALASGCETCTDEDGDYICDICWETIEHACVDEDGDHYCDICWEWMSDLCTDEDNNHACDVCWSVMDWLCSDEDNDHNCDKESCGSWLSDCEDSDGDAVCDVCGEGIYPSASSLDVEAAFGDGQATVTWRPVTEQVGEDALASYIVYICDSESQDLEDAETVAFTPGECPFTYTFTGLSNDVAYDVGVEALYTLIKEGFDLPYSLSKSTSGIPISPSAAVPGAPEITGISYGDGSITLEWTAPADNGGALIREYYVELESENEGMTIGVGLSELGGGEVLSYTVDGLTNGQSYRAGVCAVNAVGAGETAWADAACETEEPIVVSFTDLENDAWYLEAVNYVVSEGLMNGVGGTHFDPYGEASRAMIVTILYRLEGSPDIPADYETAEFADVTADWYADAVRWASYEGIVTGYSDTAFGPMDSVKREQLAAILWRYAKYKGMDVSVGENTNILSYNDAFDISEYAIPAMQWACGAGIISGKAEGILAPIDPVIRAEAAQMLMRFLAD